MGAFKLCDTQLPPGTFSGHPVITKSIHRCPSPPRPGSALAAAQDARSFFPAQTRSFDEG
ncbi:hypothetical protein E2320_000285, partial [Naja naja]